MPSQSTLQLPWFEERHRRIAGSVVDWVAGIGTPDHADPDTACRLLVPALGDAGLLAHAVPPVERDPTARHDLRAICLARETLAAHDGLADFAFAMQGLGAGPIVLAGSAVQRDAHLPGIRSGRTIAAFALSEPEAGSDVASLTARAAPDGLGHVRLTGEKTWISNGPIADLLVVFVREGDTPGARGISAFVLPTATPGFTVLERIETSAPHPLARIGLDCRAPVADRIGAPGEGMKIALATLDVFRASVGAAALGFARRALREAVQRARTRQLFGAPLGALQMSQAALADMATEVEAAAMLVYRAAWTRDQGAPRITREASMAKLFATEAAQRVIDRAVQLFGGAGVVKGVKVEELYREIRALRIYEGASEVQRVVIARSLLEAAGEEA